MRSLLRDRGRLRVLALLLIFVVPALTGCLRAHASISVSSDDTVSGEMIAAVKPRDDNDQGPQFDGEIPFRSKVSVSPYHADGYVGSKAHFSGLTLAEVPQLANLSTHGTGVDVSLRRAGDLVILEGRVDLTTVSDPDADLRFSAEFPAEVTSTNGDLIGANAVEWKLKPGVVAILTAQSRYTDPSTRSFVATAIWLGLAACLVAGIIAVLAWRDRDVRSPRFATSDATDGL